MPFQNSKEFITHLEHHAQDYNYLDEIADVFKTLAIEAVEQGDDNEAKICECEKTCFYFMDRDGRLTPMFEGTDVSGNSISYPNSENITEDCISYVQKRMQTSDNILLRARYSHVLWECKNSKHLDYVRAAVDSYLVLIRHYEEKCKADDRHLWVHLISATQAAFEISMSSKYREIDVRNEIMRLITKFVVQDTSLFGVKCDLIKLVIDNSKLFQKRDLELALAASEETSSATWDMKMYSQAIEMLELAEKVATKLQHDNLYWKRKMAIRYEEWYSIEKKRNSMQAMECCRKAIELYKVLGIQDKVDEFHKNFSELKLQIPLETYSIPIDSKALNKHLRWCKQVAEEVVALDTDQIVNYLATSPDLLPNKEELIKLVEKHASEYPMLHLVGNIVFDNKGNLAENVESDAERTEHAISKNYSIALELDYSHRINQVLFRSIEVGKLSLPKLVRTLVRNSWLAKTINDPLPGGIHRDSRRWLSLLSPALSDYFKSVKYCMKNTWLQPNMILCVDSLVLKIEGVLRDLFIFSGSFGTYPKTDHGGRHKEEDLHIQHLLHNEHAVKLLGEDDVLFLKYLLIAQNGMRLRHKVAHSQMSMSDYSLGIANLLVFAVLRLSRFMLKTRSQSKPENT